MGIKVHTGESNGHSPGAYYKAQAPAVIDPNSEDSLHKWEVVLELSRKELLEAMEKFGPQVAQIRRGLRRESEKAA